MNVVTVLVVSALRALSSQRRSADTAPQGLLKHQKIPHDAGMRTPPAPYTYARRVTHAGQNLATIPRKSLGRSARAGPLCCRRRALTALRQHAARRTLGSGRPPHTARFAHAHAVGAATGK
jgi:hypothetical protein